MLIISVISGHEHEVINLCIAHESDEIPFLIPVLNSVKDQRTVHLCAKRKLVTEYNER